MAGSIDRWVFCTTNWPGPGSGTGSVVSDQSLGFGRPWGRAARRTWWLVSVMAASSLFREVAASRPRPRPWGRAGRTPWGRAGRTGAADDPPPGRTAATPGPSRAFRQLPPDTDEK